MQHPANTGKLKLAELRAKTDRQLIALIHQQLDRALEFGDGPGAQRAHGNALVLLGCVDRITHEERAQVEAKLAQVRRILEEDSTEAAHAAVSY